MIRFATAAACLAALALLAGCPAAPPDLAAWIPAGGEFDVTVYRDEYGVPHVYGKTGPDVAYGLAYAHCEDDFDTMQEMLLSVRGLVSSVKRFEGLQNDFIVRAFRVREFVDEKYHTEVSPDVRALCAAYAAGANHYAALHPEEIFANACFPVTGKDIIAGFTLRMPFFYLIHRHLREVLDPRAAPARRTAMADTSLMGDSERGSNTFAVAPSRSADGFTRLAVNSHQPWTGPVAWYEARLHSEDGLDIVGGLFPGAPVILHGHNRDLGWAHTVNIPDLCDVYELTLNPDNPDQYLFDGEWRDFEKSEAAIPLRLWGALTVTVKRELLWSVHGPAVRKGDGAYAVRFIGYGEVRQLDQFYAMNKARNYEEFRAAVATQGYFCMNFGYADKDGNIWYLYNAKFPVRAEGHDWSGVVPGDTSETLWTEYWPFDDLPQVLNPPSGFVQNCNSSPWRTTVGPGNPNPEDFPAWLGIPDEMTNRGWRALELFGEDESITREAFDACKFDQRYSRRSMVGGLWEAIVALGPFEDNMLREAQALVREWDFSAAPDSRAAALVILTGEPIIRAQLMGSTPPELEAQFRDAAAFLMRHHGRLDVPWVDINRLVRGDVNAGLGGGPDVLNAVYGNRMPDGTLHGHSGDCYILQVEWDPEGNVSSRSVHNFGAASTRPDSPHYADQVDLFVNHRFKPVRLDREDLLSHAQAAYRPGEPWRAPAE